MSCVFLKLLEQNFLWGAYYVVDLGYLVEFVVAWKERVERNNLKEDTSNAPQIHFVPVITVSQKTFRSTVPPRTDVLCIGLLTVDTTTATKVC